MSILAIASGLIQIAPTIAGWFGGDKAEEAAERVCDVAKVVTGIDDPQKAVEAVQGDPELQFQFRTLLAEQKHEMDKLYLKDVKDARKMQVTALKDGRSRISREFVYWYAAFLTLVAVIYIGCITFIDIPEENVRFADTALGFVLGSVLASIIQFFYGSSKPVREDD